MSTKKVMIIIAAVLLLLLLIAALLPKEYKVEKRTITIAADISNVFVQVADFENWKNWNLWTPADSLVKYFISTPSTGSGAYYTWSGKNVGKGKQTIIKIEQNKSIEIELQYEGTEPAINLWTFEGDGKQTTVSWSISGKTQFPMGRFFGLLMDNFLGGDLEKNLENLKMLCEQEN